MPAELLLLLIVAFVNPSCQVLSSLRMAAILDDQTVCGRGERLALALAREQINGIIEVPAKARVEVDIFELQRDSQYETTDTMCQILPKGVVSVLGPSSSPASASTVSHICGEKEIPHIKVGPEETPRLQYLRFASVSLYPSNEDVSLAVSRILKSFNYPSASLICAKAECLLRLEELVRGFLISKETLSVRMLDDSRDPTPLLKEIRDDKVSTIIIDANASISHLVLRKYFRMELMHAEKLRKEKQEFEKAAMDVGHFDHPEEILKGELARIVYKNSISKIKGAEFHVSLLAIAQLFDFAKDLQKEIYDDLQVLHTDDPLTWDYVARRELKIESQPGEEQPVSKQGRAVEVGQREERSCAVYEEAVKALPTEAMWKCYITFCLERFSKKTSSVSLRGQRLERTMLAFMKAHELKLLSEVQYKQWIDLLLRQDLLEEALQVAEAGTELFQDSVTMWQTKLLVLLDSKSPDVDVHFEEAFAHLKPQVCLPLWISWAEWSESAKSQEDTEAIFKKALLAVTGASSVTLKEKYLDWAYRSGGYKKARAVFKSLQESRPFSVEFFRKMMEFEKEQEYCKMANLREYYERALREFGSTDSDLWMDYIKEELNHPFGRPENSGQIYWRAMKMLRGQSAELFVAKYALHQTGH